MSVFAVAIIDTIGVIGTSSLAYIDTAKIIFMLSRILVSWIWFFSLALAGKMIGKLDSSGTFILMLNKLSAIIMWGTSIFLIFSLK